MKKFLFMAVAAIAALSSCSNNDEFEQKQTGNQGLVFTATMEGAPETRATYDGTNKCASWVIGDKISINGVSYSAQTAGTTTTFTADGEDATGDTYKAYFPASLYNNGTPTLPANIEEEWVDGKFNMPMYAHSESTDLHLQFKNLCGVLKITGTSDQLASVKCITINSTNCATSGAFKVDGDSAKLNNASKTANTVTVTYTDAVSTDATGKVFYIAIPAQTYKNLSIAVSDGATTKVMTTTKDKEIMVNRNSIYPITFNGELTKGTTGRTNGSAGWVQLWGGGPKFAEFNVGANSATGYGGYYCWGKSTDQDLNQSYNKEIYYTLTGTDDTATNLWGNNWRMPTDGELKGLPNNCDGVWTSVNGVYGRKFTGKGAYSSNSVFLPAGGKFSTEISAQVTTGCIDYKNEKGYYWSSNAKSSPYRLFLSSTSQSVNTEEARQYGFSVRAVLAE